MKKISTILMASIAISIIVFSCKKDPVIVQNKNVLIIYDDTTINVNTVSLKAAIETAGYIVSFSDANESKWDNTNPSLDNFFAVVHLNGDTYDTEMPLAGQNALVNFVKNKSGFYISSEWNGYQISEGEMLTMQDLILLDRGSAASGLRTFNSVAEQVAHPVLYTIPASFEISAEVNGNAHVFAVEPSVVLMKDDVRDAVVVREFGKGKILGFHHAGNWSSGTPWSNPNIQKIVVNFLDWRE